MCKDCAPFALELVRQKIKDSKEIPFYFAGDDPFDRDTAMALVGFSAGALGKDLGSEIMAGFDYLLKREPEAIEPLILELIKVNEDRRLAGK